MRSDLTKREEQLMDILWQHGPLKVSEMLQYYDEDPKPHFNTVSTMVRTLERKGYTAHSSEGVSYRYFSVVTREDYGYTYLKGVVKDYFDNSYKRALTLCLDGGVLSKECLEEIIAEHNK